MTEHQNIEFKQLWHDDSLKPALKWGFVEMTIPSKPVSRLQRYRFTAKGMAFLKK